MSLRNTWILFAQTVTVALALLFVVSSLRPEWLWRNDHPEVRWPAVSPQESAPNPSVSAQQNSYREAVSRAVPAVVNIFSRKEVKGGRNPLFTDPLFHRFFGNRSNDRAQQVQGLGSGVIVSTSGHILTNQHVIEAADEIEVALSDGRKVRAKVIGSDPETDLAVIQIDAKPIRPIHFGNDSALQLGDVVLAIGNPFGVGQTVTMGIVSGLGRTPGINTYENFIQTDAAINPGNSGGALVDAQGNLVGINTAIFSRSGGSLGIGFAIPASSARNVLESIISTGSVSRGWIGIETSELTPEIADALKLPAKTGTLVSGVLRGGPAEKSGVKPGDVLTTISGMAIKDQAAMLNLIAALPPGKRAALTLIRNRQEIELLVEVDQRPRPRQQSP